MFRCSDEVNIRRSKSYKATLPFPSFSSDQLMALNPRIEKSAFLSGQHPAGSVFNSGVSVYLGKAASRAVNLVLRFIKSWERPESWLNTWLDSVCSVALFLREQGSEKYSRYWVELDLGFIADDRQWQVRDTHSMLLWGIQRDLWCIKSTQRILVHSPRALDSNYSSPLPEALANSPPITRRPGKIALLNLQLRFSLGDLLSRVFLSS